MGGLSNPAESVIIMDVNVENKKFSTERFPHSFCPGIKTMWKTLFGRKMHIIHIRKVE